MLKPLVFNYLKHNVSYTRHTLYNKQSTYTMQFTDVIYDFQTQALGGRPF